MSDPQTITFEQIDVAQELLSDEGLAHWFVTVVNGTETDHRAWYRAERVLPGGRKFEVMHNEPHVLVQLCREADARLDKSPDAVGSVANGTADTHNTGGES